MAAGYPDTPEKGAPSRASTGRGQGAKVFHAGTALWMARWWPAAGAC
jgi:phosphoribosylamine-glycine ligase